MVDQVLDGDIVALIICEECGGDWCQFGIHFNEWFKQRQLSQTSGEWRFQGDLGFGGKLWYGPQPTFKLIVNCYPEDMNPGRKMAIASVNRRLYEYVTGKILWDG